MEGDVKDEADDESKDGARLSSLLKGGGLYALAKEGN